MCVFMGGDDRDKENNIGRSQFDSCWGHNVAKTVWRPGSHPHLMEELTELPQALYSWISLGGEEKERLWKKREEEEERRRNSMKGREGRKRGIREKKEGKGSIARCFGNLTKACASSASLAGTWSLDHAPHKIITVLLQATDKYWGYHCYSLDPSVFVQSQPVNSQQVTLA